MTDIISSEVSESAFEYLLAEILTMQPLHVPEDEQMTLDNFKIKDAATAFQQRIDNMGYEVGYRFVEKIAQQRPLSSDHLEIVKFVCKDFWEEIFKKKVDKLQTNHRGVFVLSDFKFKWLDRYTSDDVSARQTALTMLNFPCGILRGALSNLGLPCTVTAEINTIPGCTFNIRIKSS